MMMVAMPYCGFPRVPRLPDRREGAVLPAAYPEGREGCMRQKYVLEIVFLVLVLVVSLLGFSSLYMGEQTGPDAYQSLHIVTSLAWLLLLLGQLVLINQRNFVRHRVIGTSIFAAGPVVVASMTLLTVHSAAKDAVAGRADMLVVQNVAFTVELALLVFLAFLLRRNRAVHGSLLLSTALMFMVIALFFSLISYVPGYRADGPGTRPHFAEAGQMSALIGAVVGLLFFLKNWRAGWPWLLTSAFFLLDGYAQFLVAQADLTMALTALVASVGRAPAFLLGLTIFGALLVGAWRGSPPRRTPREGITEATSL